MVWVSVHRHFTARRQNVGTAVTVRSGAAEAERGRARGRKPRTGLINFPFDGFVSPRRKAGFGVLETVDYFRWRGGRDTAGWLRDWDEADDRLVDWALSRRSNGPTRVRGEEVFATGDAVWANRKGRRPRRHRNRWAVLRPFGGAAAALVAAAPDRHRIVCRGANGRFTAKSLGGPT